MAIISATPAKNPFKAATISKLLIKFSAPAIAGMFVNAMYNIISRIYIGREIGSLGIAAISITFPVGMIFTAFSALVGVGANALFSIRLGEKKEDEAQTILGNAFVMLIILSAAVTISFYLFLDPILAFLGANEELRPYVEEYLRRVLPGYFVFAISLGMNNFIRSSGHPKTAMATQLIGAAINLALAPIFIFKLKWGMTGAAMATVCGQVVSFTWVLTFFLREKKAYCLRWKCFKLKLHIIYNSMLVGFSQFSFQIASSALNIILNHSLLKYGGNLAVSAIGIAISINTIFVLPVIGLSQGAQPLIGYNYGAKKFTTAIQTLKLAIRWGLVITGIGFVIIEVLAQPLVTVFNGEDEALIRMSTHAVRILNIMLPFVTFQILTTTFFQAINSPIKAAFLSLSRQVLLIIPLVIILPLFMGLDGVFVSPPLADLISGLIALYLLKRYFNKHKQNFFFSRKFGFSRKHNQNKSKQKAAS